MGEKTWALSLFFIFACLSNVYGNVHSYDHQLRKLQAFTAEIASRDSISPFPSPSPTRFSPSPSSPSVITVTPSPKVYHVTSYGADPTGKLDSTQAILQAISDALEGPSNGFLMQGISNLGGAQINLEGGNYLISQPLQFPIVSRGNLMIHGGTLKASDDFPRDGYLLDLSTSSSNGPEFLFEFITLRDLLLDANFRGGGIQVINSLRTSIDNCYITHFTTNGIIAKGGHETYIRNSFLGQHITAGGDKGERNFSGTAINLAGNDNSVTDVVIFSAEIGVIVSGQANLLSGIHCYNKATGFGGTGIYLKLPGLTQTRIVDSYLDYTGIVAEDPVQLTISNTFFLGDGFVKLKSINGVVNGVNIVDNMFSGSNKGIDIVQLDQSNGPFKTIEQVVVDRNNVKGMNLKGTIGSGVVEGNGTSWTMDFNPILVFPNLIKHVQYTFFPSGNVFVNHALRNISNNKVIVESNVQVPARVLVTVDQGK
ncbi:polygalacturonase QRT3 [Solanum lycopersicum]|uniref:Rhamnogalacturonase A/B/Epimerase-like pectate lyase domain-containing protein n=1 Tax=Solanum lycopersicum TaxID=4081 RepID=A0A3Q7F2N3_SOLLC|nr:polygalacturonase QRT3 [Solanum lycopersicum]